MDKKISPLLKRLKFFQIPKIRFANGWSEKQPYDRDWEKTYRRRWQHDKVVRTTHGVNCTGSCSWRVFVKDGLITWENQAVDYPTTGPEMPEYEPRGCPRGATFSWYIYSPLRIRYPYIRNVLLKLWREAKSQHANPLQAWQSIVEDPEKRSSYKSVRGKGGLVRTSWDEVNEIIAAMMLYTIKTYGPDRLAGFSPIPAMSMVSYAAGARFLSLVGAPMLSFYDWYADLPPASPQVWGEQTDVPESGDWYNSGYIIMWGSNVPLTRTPDAHFMIESRYRGTKVVAVSPDYAEYVRYADNWLPIHPGSDGALAQAMTHVILKEFYVEKKTEFFINYAKRFTDLPFLITLKKKGDSYVADRFLVANDLNLPINNSEWKPLIFDINSQQYFAPNGSIGHRWEGKGKWNLKMEDENGNPYDPILTFLGNEDEVVPIHLPYFDDNQRLVLHRSVPAKKINNNGEKLYVTTVYDLMLAHYGINRGLTGDYPIDYDDPKPYTPKWQEEFTGVDQKLAIKIAREFAQNAIDTKGRSMIIMGAGINHWYHADTIYRTILNLVILTGSEGVNGGGWAHYVGQEKVRPIEGWSTIAFARDWSLPPRLQNGTSYYYFATDQYRYEEIPVSELTSPTIDQPRYEHPADYNALAVRLGWMPFYPQFNRNSLNLAEEAKKTGATSNEEIIKYVVNELKGEKLQFAVEDPDNQVNIPRGFFIWRANLLPSSGKGHDYFLKYFVGSDLNNVLGSDKSNLKTTEITWHDRAPEGKVDLLINLDFRMTGTALFSDILLPAATWYEKYDLSSTDMHPYVHPFNPAINAPWEAKPDWDIYKGLAEVLSQMAKEYYPHPVQDIVATPLLHDTPGETAQPFGKVRDWKKGEVEPIPGKTMPSLTIVDRDYTQIYDKFISLGPLAEKNPIGFHGIGWSATEEYEQLKSILRTVNKEGVGKGLPSLITDRNVAEAILLLSSATNGKMTKKAWEAEEKKTGLELKDIAQDREGEQIRFFDITQQPRQVIPTPVFTGSNKNNKRYTAFTTSIERLVPFRTITGRQQFYLDHEIFLEFGEGLPMYKPTLPTLPFAEHEHKPNSHEKELTLRYLTPHGKWNIHSTYGDNQIMQTLFRGGPYVWLNNQDADEVGIQDNDWIEVFNRNGIVVARAVVSHRIPKGSANMYHSQDRTLNIPGSTITKNRGGSHNSPTRVHLKPTHVVGGYAQLSYGFNYYGPTGNQRDLKVVIKKLKEVDWLEN